MRGVWAARRRAKEPVLPPDSPMFPRRTCGRRSVSRWILAAGAAAFLLGGCAHDGPDAALTADALSTVWPAQWASETSTPAMPGLGAGFYGVFSDPQLVELIQEALTHNADLRAAAHRLRGAEWLLRPVRTADRPQARLDVQAAQLRTDGRSGRSRQATASMGWALDVWGRLADERASAEAEFAARRADFAAARLSIAALVAQRWISLRAAQQEAVLLRDRLEALAALRQFIRDRYRAGLTVLEDEAAVRTQIELARAQLGASEEAALVDRRALEVLIGRVPEAAIVGPQGLPDIARPIATAPARVLAARPDVRAAFSRIEGADHARRAAYAAWLPDLTLTASAASSRDGTALIPDVTQWSLVGALGQTLLDHGARRALARARNAEAEARVEDYRQVVLSALAEVENALSSETALARQHGALGAALEAVRLNEAHARDQYRRGLVSAREMIEAQLQRADIEIARTRTKAARLNARVQLGLALGLPWPGVGGDGDA